MRTSQRWRLIALAISVCFATTTGICPDEYVYTEQPPEWIVCDPFQDGSIKLDCAIVGSDILYVNWLFSAGFGNQQGTVLLQNSTKYTLFNHTSEVVQENGKTTKISGVQLTVHDLNEADVGYFWCQGVVDDGHLSISTRFNLLPEHDYTSLGFFSCGDEVTRRVGTWCAVVLQPTESTATLPTAPPTTEITSTLVTTVPMTVATTGQPPQLTFSEFVVLYAILGVVGLLLVLCLVLGIMSVLLCRRRCAQQQSKGGSIKDVGFDHISNKSDFALITRFQKISSPPHHFYQPESIHETRSTQRDLSGDYAEIGPALIANTDRLSHLRTEVPSQPPPPLPQARVVTYEHKYDIPLSEPTPYYQSHGYHMTDGFSETSSFSTPPDTPPHDYQSVSSPVEPLPPPYPQDSEPRLSVLETIPEHPYHVLEQSTNQMAAPAIPREDDYDRLVSPHLYHILEHSPSLNKPRVNSFVFSGDEYSQLDSPCKSSLPESPVNSDTALSPAPSSSLNSLELFDDPQYLHSSADFKSTSPQDAGTCDELKVNLAKYSGDYERDPLYMRRIQSGGPRVSPDSLIFDKNGSQDDSGFCSDALRNTKFKRQTSLPDLPHVYQALEVKTMDASQPYEFVKRDLNQ